MRAILVILIVVVVAAIAAIQLGLIDISQTRAARAPDVDVSRNGVTATGGQTPAFEVETGSVSVGSTQQTVKVPEVTVKQGEANVSVPAIEVRRPADSNEAAPTR